MKQHYTLYTLLFSLFTITLFGQQKPCNNYACVIDKVEHLMKQSQKDYKAILDNLDSAEGYPDSKAEQIRTLRRRVFVLIENEKNEAKRAIKQMYKAQNAEMHAQNERMQAQKAMEDAIKQLEIEKQTAIAEKTKAQAAEAKAKAVLDKIYFYDGKFGLASKLFLGSPIYGFIDKDLNTKIDFNYHKALPFDDIGFAKVSKDYNDIALIIDTLGYEYKLATDMLQLDSNITALDLREKKFDNIPPSVFRHKQLQILLLNYDSLKTLSDEIGGLTQLKCLNLQHNSLTNLPTEFTKLTNLRSLNLGSNQFTQFPTELYKLTHLQFLDLGDNPIINFSLEGISNLTKLQSLLLYNLNLKSLPVEIGQLKALRYLNLHKNQLKNLPLVFNELSNLQELILGENQLTNLTGITNLTNLQTLDLIDNEITTLPDEIKNLKHLKVLNLSGNSISIEEQTRIKALLPNCRVSFNEDLANEVFSTFFTKPEEKKDTIAIMYDIIMLIKDLENQYMADTSMLNVKIELAIQYNEIAWYLLQKGAFIEAEQCIRKGLGFDATNVFLPTNLPTSLLLQGKYQEAENAYKVWKNRPFNQQDLPLYKDIFLEDLKTLEKIGVIPNERRIDVEKVRLLLTNE